MKVKKISYHMVAISCICLFAHAGKKASSFGIPEGSHPCSSATPLLTIAVAFVVFIIWQV